MDRKATVGEPLNPKPCDPEGAFGGPRGRLPRGARAGGPAAFDK